MKSVLFVVWSVSVMAAQTGLIPCLPPNVMIEQNGLG